MGYRQPQNPTPFTRRCWEDALRCPDEAGGYWPHDYLRALQDAGDDFAPRAREYLWERGRDGRDLFQPGLERLAKEKALRLSMEWAIAFGDFPEFDERDRQHAHDRLRGVALLHGHPEPPPLLNVTR